MTRIYLDVCCLNRPFDDQTQVRVRLEAEAVLLILARCETGDWEWMSSEVVNAEIGYTPDPERRFSVQQIALQAHHSIRVEASVIERAYELQSWGFSAYDALHLACAEHGKADVFLTTDDRLLGRANTYSNRIKVSVDNPLHWLEETE